MQMESRSPAASINGGYHDCGDCNSYQDTGVCDSEGNILPDLLESHVDSSLQGLDMGAIKKNTYDRTRAAMAAINPTLAKKVLPLPSKLSREEVAAICIQAHFRGYLARKLFVQLLYDKYMKEDEEMEARRRQQVEEGELLVENYRLNVEMEENTCLRENLRRGVECDVITIQRAWREHKRKSHDQLSHGVPGAIDAYSKPNFGMVTQPTYSTPDSANFHIRTNPFMGSNGNSSYCDDDNLSDVFNDSLEQVTEENLRNTQEHGPHRHIYDSESEFEGDTFNDEPPGIASVSSPAELPSPTTDWESIESCLTSEGETQELENSELLDSSNDRLKHFSLKPKDLQICFVDDTLLSDVEGDEDSCLIKEYIIDTQDISDEEKRDSGCVAGDEEMSESFSIKTVSPTTLENQEISQEDTEKVLLELSKQDSEDGVDDKKCPDVMSGWTDERLRELTLGELKELKKNMAQLIKAQNEVLVTELMQRDSLHLKQDSLLMDVEDASKKFNRLRLKKS